MPAGLGVGIPAVMKKTATAVLLMGLPLVVYRASGCGGHVGLGLVGAVDVLTAMAAATGAFIVAGIVRVFRIERLYPVVRPALVMGASAQLCVLAGLLWLTGVAPAVTIPRLLPPAYVASSLWHGPVLPAELFISAVLAGISMLVLAVYAGDRAGRGIFDIDYIKGVGILMLALICVMLALRMSDFFIGGGLTCASCRWGDAALGWYAAEVGLGLVLPGFMLLGRDIRSRRRGLIGVSLFVVAGIIINRMGLATNGWRYPSVTAGLAQAMEIYAAIWLAVAAVTLYWYVEGRLSGGSPPAVEVPPGQPEQPG